MHYGKGFELWASETHKYKYHIKRVARTCNYSLQEMQGMQKLQELRGGYTVVLRVTVILELGRYNSAAFLLAGL